MEKPNQAARIKSLKQIIATLNKEISLLKKDLALESKKVQACIVFMLLYAFFMIIARIT